MLASKLAVINFLFVLGSIFVNSKRVANAKHESASALHTGSDANVKARSPTDEDKVAMARAFLKARYPRIGVQRADDVDIRSLLGVLTPDAGINILYPTREGPYVGDEAITNYLTIFSRNIDYNIVSPPEEPHVQHDGSVVSKFTVKVQGGRLYKQLQQAGVPCDYPIVLKAVFYFTKPWDKRITAVKIGKLNQVIQRSDSAPAPQVEPMLSPRRLPRANSKPEMVNPFLD